MSDENKLIRDNGRGMRAKQLLDDELLSEAFDVLEQAYTLGWRNTTIADRDAREKLFLAVNIISKVRHHLQKAIEDGKLAQAELNEIAATAERRKIFGII